MPVYSIRVPYDHNLRFLPLMYLVPEELLARCPILCGLPRIPHEIFRSEESMQTVESDAFRGEIMDAIAALVFPHFGFPGWKEHYTGYFPVWRLCYLLPTWAKAVEDEIGWGLQRLFQLPRNAPIIVLPKEQSDVLFERVVKRVIEEQGWQPMLDAIKEMPCIEDYEPIPSNVRTDFIRGWYHTRSKNVQEVSLESYYEEEDRPLFLIQDAVTHVEEHVISKVFLESFLQTLTKKDRKLLALRQAGYSWKEIAEKLAHSSHSCALKRVNLIMKRYKEYGKDD